MNRANYGVIALALTTLYATALSVRAQPGRDEDAGFDGPGRRSERVPTAARRAAEWRGSSDPSAGAAWHFSAGAGVAFFTGDDAVDGDPGFSAELRLAREMTGDFYVVGSYLVATAETESPDPDGATDRDDYFLHVPTIGIGLRVEATPSIHLFVEPKVGAVFGDVDAAPVGGATAGADFEIQSGLSLRVGITGLFTDAALDTPAGDVDLSGIFSVGVGLVFEF